MGSPTQIDKIALNKIGDIFGDKTIPQKLIDGQGQEGIPTIERFRSGAIFKRGVAKDQLYKVGKKWGFFRPLGRPLALSVFTTKGGVLKSTLALNLARVAALHGLKTCVVGLDMQGDITQALGYDDDLSEEAGLGEVLSRLERTKGLSDFFHGQARLEELPVPTDLPHLFLIPETPELVACNEALSNINRREYWLKERVITPLKESFDFIVMDCSPNWNKLTTNALIGCDALISPLECKINNFRNFKVFRHFLAEFKSEMRTDFPCLFIPTKFGKQRKLSLEIKNWYAQNVEGYIDGGIRESTLGEEATAMNLSFLEYAPTRPFAQEMKDVLTAVYKVLYSHCQTMPKASPYETLPSSKKDSSPVSPHM